MPGDVRSATGLAIRFARERKGWTQRELAQHSGVAPAHLGRIELGRVDPSVGLVSRIAAGLGMALAELSAEIDAERRRAGGGES